MWNPIRRAAFARVVRGSLLAATAAQPTGAFGLEDVEQHAKQLAATTYEERRGIAPQDLGYAGLRVHNSVKTASYQDGSIDFLGASYFRAVGKDIEVRLDLRPGAWVEPKERWDPGRIELVEIPTRDGANDNIVSYWVPEAPASPVEPCAFLRHDDDALTEIRWYLLLP